MNSGLPKLQSSRPSASTAGSGMRPHLRFPGGLQQHTSSPALTFCLSKEQISFLPALPLSRPDFLSVLPPIYLQYLLTIQQSPPPGSCPAYIDIPNLRMKGLRGRHPEDSIRQTAADLLLLGKFHLPGNRRFPVCAGRPQAPLELLAKAQIWLPNTVYSLSSGWPEVHLL